MSDKQQYYTKLHSKLESLIKRTESGTDTQDNLSAQLEARQLYAAALLNPEIEPIEFHAGTPLHHINIIAKGNLTDIATGSVIGTGQAVSNTLTDSLSLKDISGSLKAAAHNIKENFTDAVSDPINYVQGMTMKQRAELAAIYLAAPDLNAALAERTQSSTIASYLMTEGIAGAAKTAKHLPGMTGGAAAITPEGVALPIADSYAAKGALNAKPAIHAMMANAATASRPSQSTPPAAAVTEAGGYEKIYHLKDAKDGSTVWAVVKDAHDGFRTVEIHKAKLHEYAPASLPKQPPMLTAQYRLVQGFDQIFTDKVALVELNVKLPKEITASTSLNQEFALRTFPVTKQGFNNLLREHLNDALTAIQQDAKIQSGRPYVQAVTDSDQVIKGGTVDKPEWHKRLEDAGLNVHDQLLKHRKVSTMELSSANPAITDPAQIFQKQIALRAQQNGLKPDAVMAAMQHAMHKQAERKEQQNAPTMEA